MLLSGKNSLIKDLTNKNVTMTSRDNCLKILFRAEFGVVSEKEMEKSNIRFSKLMNLITKDDLDLSKSSVMEHEF